MPELHKQPRRQTGNRRFHSPFAKNCEIRISRRAKRSGMEIIMSSPKNRRGKRSKNRNNRSSAARTNRPANAPLPAEHQESSVPADANAADVTEITLSEAAAAADHSRMSFSGTADAGDIPEMSFSGKEDVTDVREMSFSGAEDEADHPERSFLDKADSAADFSRKKHRLPADRFSPTMLFGEVDPFNGDGPTDPNDKLRRAILPLAGIIACLIIVLYFQARLAGFSPGSSLIPGFSNGSSKPAAETSEPIEESQESDNTEPVPAPDTNFSESPEKSTDTPVPEEDSPNDDADNSADQNNEDTASEEESDQSEEDVEYTEEEPEYTEEDSEEEYYEDEGDHEEEEYYEDEDNYEDEGNQEYYEEEFDLREG